MTNENIVKRLRDESDKATLRVDDGLAAVLNEAAAEIEYLRKRCEQIDQERQERSLKAI